MNNHNDYVFSKEYNEKKEAILRSIRKNEKQEKQFSRKFPLKIVLAVGLMTVILTTSLFAAAGVIPPAKKYTALRTDYVPEGYDEIECAFKDIEIDSLEYYVECLDGEKFIPITEMSYIPDTVDYEVFETNGHYAQILTYNHWAPDQDDGTEEYAHKTLYVYFEKEDLVVHIIATNKISVEELRKVADGIHLEETEDENLAVRINHQEK